MSLRPRTNYDTQLKIAKEVGKDFTTQVQNCCAKLLKYQEKIDSSPLYGCAMLLNPFQRTRHLEVMTKSRKNIILAGVRKTWKEYMESHKHLHRPSNISHEYISSLAETCLEQDLDDYEKMRRRVEIRVMPVRSEDELEVFLKEKPYNSIHQQSALQWWFQESNRTRYPILSHLAIEILSIPAMSDEPERVFSGGRRTISWERMSIGATNVERTECLKSWLR